MIKITDLKSNKNKVVKGVITAIAFATVATLGAYTQGYLSFDTEESIHQSDKLSITNSAVEGVHFLKNKTMPEEKNTITLFYSYKSKMSKLAFTELKKLEKTIPDAKFNYIPLNINPSWDIAFKAGITLDSIAKGEIKDSELFDFFASKKGDDIKQISKLLVEHKIDPISFENMYSSSEVSSISAQHFENYINKDISFIPDIYINGNRQVVLGSLDRYSDIKFIYDTLNEKVAITSPKKKQ
jgi:hypothetical protein